MYPKATYRKDDHIANTMIQIESAFLITEACIKNRDPMITCSNRGRTVLTALQLTRRLRRLMVLTLTPMQISRQ